MSTPCLTRIFMKEPDRKDLVELVSIRRAMDGTPEVHGVWLYRFLSTFEGRRCDVLPLLLISDLIRRGIWCTLEEPGVSICHHDEYHIIFDQEKPVDSVRVKLFYGPPDTVFEPAFKGKVRKFGRWLGVA